MTIDNLPPRAFQCLHIQGPRQIKNKLVHVKTRLRCQQTMEQKSLLQWGHRIDVFDRLNTHNLIVESSSSAERSEGGSGSGQQAEKACPEFQKRCRSGYYSL